MPSPFPGMDPYIEARGLWEDFHPHLVEQIYGQLADVAPDRYVVRVGERSYMMFFEEDEEDEKKEKKKRFHPDVRITDPRGEPQRSQGRGGAAVAELEANAIDMQAIVGPDYVETFVEIREADQDGRLVTCIEVLSPVNKRPNSPGWDLYQRKRQGLFLGRVSLIEIDLLRRGQRLPMDDEWPDSPYTLLLARAGHGGSCKVWPAHYRQPLPVIPVPLARPDPDLTLDLQPLIADIYKRSRYALSIDYAKPITPPLPKADAAWLKRQLPGGRRTRRKPPAG